MTTVWYQGRQPNTEDETLEHDVFLIEQPGGLLELLLVSTKLTDDLGLDGVVQMLMAKRKDIG